MSRDEPTGSEKQTPKKPAPTPSRGLKEYFLYLLPFAVAGFMSGFGREMCARAWVALSQLLSALSQASWAVDVAQLASRAGAALHSPVLCLALFGANVLLALPLANRLCTRAPRLVAWPLLSGLFFLISLVSTLSSSSLASTGLLSAVAEAQYAALTLTLIDHLARGKVARRTAFSAAAGVLVSGAIVALATSTWYPVFFAQSVLGATTAWILWLRTPLSMPMRVIFLLYPLFLSLRTWIVGPSVDPFWLSLYAIATLSKGAFWNLPARNKPSRSQQAKPSRQIQNAEHMERAAEGVSRRPM